MSLDKAIKHNKEWRQPWHDARAFDPWCRNHGNDTWYTKKVLQGRKKRAERKMALELREGLTEYYAWAGATS